MKYEAIKQNDGVDIERPFLVITAETLEEYNELEKLNEAIAYMEFYSEEQLPGELCDVFLDQKNRTLTIGIAEDAVARGCFEGDPFAKARLRPDPR